MERMKYLKKKILKRKMTRTEKILLSILGGILVVWGIAELIISPQHVKIQSLIQKREDYQERILKINTILKEEDRIDERRQDLYQEKTTLTSSFFPYIDQAEIIFLLNELIEGDSLDVLDIRFSEPKEESIDDFSFPTIDIYMPFRASYQGLIETLKRMKESPKRILITDLIVDSIDTDMLRGNLSMRIYALDRYQKMNNDDLHLDYRASIDKDNPFFPLVEANHQEQLSENDGHVENQHKELSSLDKEESFNRVILEDFESGNFYFIPSHKYVKGGSYKSTNAKSNSYSIRFEYHILALEDENRAYLDLSDRNISLGYPPETIGLWAHSFGYSPATLGIRMKGQAGEIYDVEIIRGISWIGWNYIDFKPPLDLRLYPLQLDKIYIELAYNKDDYGVLLVDQIEAKYPKGINESSEYYTYYVVEKGDTLDSISMKFYGTTKKGDIIMKKNEIKSDKDIKEGKILVIPDETR